MDWVATLQRYARRVNPLLADLLHSLPYYWVSAQVEYATDLVFTSPQALRDFAPRLLEYSTCSFTPQDVMTFLGRKLYGKFEGEVITDALELVTRDFWATFGRRVVALGVPGRTVGGFARSYRDADRASRALANLTSHLVRGHPLPPTPNPC